MATVRDIVTLALKQARVIGIGQTAPDPLASQGLTAFQTMFDMWVINGMFGRLTDLYKTANYEAKEGERITAPTGVVITLPATIDDCGGERAPRDLSLVEYSINGVRSVKLYDRTAWVDLLGFTLGTAAPLAERGQGGLASCTARVFCEMFGREMLPYTARQAAMFEGALSSKFGTTQDREGVDYF